jgi:uncharacterized protein with FMN-binding domain
MRRALIGAGGALAGAIAVLAGHTLAGPASPELTERPGPARPGVTPTEPPLRDGTATGPRIETDYGPVQVRVSVREGAIIDIEALILPSHHERSRWIAANLVPRLRQRVLSAQTADVDVMSGATFTSGGYLRSLQSALDELR